MRIFKHIEHYIRNCSFGDWFVLHQMGRNMNRRFFASFVTLLSRRVNPDPELLAADAVDGEFKRLRSESNLPDKIFDLTYTGEPMKNV